MTLVRSYGEIRCHKTPHVEKHFTGSEVVRDIVIGMSDGLTVPFALASRTFWDCPLDLYRHHRRAGRDRSRVDLPWDWAAISQPGVMSSIMPKNGRPNSARWKSSPPKKKRNGTGAYQNMVSIKRKAKLVAEALSKTPGGMDRFHDAL